MDKVAVVEGYKGLSACVSGSSGNFFAADAVIFSGVRVSLLDLKVSRSTAIRPSSKRVGPHGCLW